MLLQTLASSLLSLAALSTSTAPERSPRPFFQDEPLTAAVRDEVLAKTARALREAYVFPDVAEEMIDSLEERAKRGEYDELDSGAGFASILTAHLQAVSHDKHLRVVYGSMPERWQGEESPEERARFATEAAHKNFGFERLERLGGNIGYLDLRWFAPLDLSRETCAGAMALLGNTDALIIDLRRNGGGSPNAVRFLCSYLFGPEPVHLNDLYYRPENRTEEFWTLRELPGRRYLDKDVFVLTGPGTFSGAEEFAYDLQCLERATIVGERSGGGANPGGPHRLNSSFELFVPSGRAINPITKTNWEGTGVAPDVAVDEEHALERAQRLALERLLAKCDDPDRQAELREALAALPAAADAPGAAR